MIIGLQLVATIFSLLMIYISILHYKRREINKIEFFTWVFIWLVTILTILFPDVLRTFARLFFITRLFDLMVVGGFILVISMATGVYLKTRRIEKKVEEYVRKDALGKMTGRRQNPVKRANNPSK